MEAVNQFEENQTLEALNAILSAGIEVKKMESGEWVNTIVDLVLPVRFVRLYSKVGNTMILSGIGIY